MTTSNFAQPSHWCASCNRHFQLNQVRVIRPAPEQPEGEVELMVCPCCDSFDIQTMQEAERA